MSFDHIAKAGQLLSREGYVDAVRGRGGGMGLALDPSEILIGQVLRATEAGTGLGECMLTDVAECIFAACCGLTPILSQASEQFYRLLDERILSEAIPRKRLLRKALGVEPTGT